MFFLHSASFLNMHFSPSFPVLFSLHRFPSFLHFHFLSLAIFFLHLLNLLYSHLVSVQSLIMQQSLCLSELILKFVFVLMSEMWALLSSNLVMMWCCCWWHATRKRLTLKWSLPSGTLCYNLVCSSIIVLKTNMCSLLTADFYWTTIIYTTGKWGSQLLSILK